MVGWSGRDDTGLLLDLDGGGWGSFAAWGVDGIDADGMTGAG